MQLDVGAAAKPPARAVLTPRMFSGRLSSAPTQNDINCVSPTISAVKEMTAILASFARKV